MHILNVKGWSGMGAVLHKKIAELVRTHGGQHQFARFLGVSQSTISRYLATTKLTPEMARALDERLPGIRNEVRSAFFQPKNMHVAVVVGASDDSAA